MSSSRRRGGPKRSSCDRSSNPNTARMITSSVIACMLGSTEKRRERGQPATWRSATSAITSP